MSGDPAEPMADHDVDDDGHFHDDLTCEWCGGSGCDPVEGFMPCEDCDGEGYRWWE